MSLQQAPQGRRHRTQLHAEVPHAHVHLIPIDNLLDMDFKLAHMLPQDELAATAASIRSAIAALGYQHGVA